jgi:hypothetical protein
VFSFCRRRTRPSIRSGGAIKSARGIRVVIKNELAIVILLGLCAKQTLDAVSSGDISFLDYSQYLEIGFLLCLQQPAKRLMKNNIQSRYPLLSGISEEN